MQKKIFIVLAMLVNFIAGTAQTTSEKFIVLSSPETKIGDKVYIARDYIDLLSNYSTLSYNYTYSIDEDLIFDITADEKIDPIDNSSRLIDTEKPFGQITGDFNVTGSGAASYIISIYTPEGKSGIVPNVNLSYNSNLTTGILGPGWTLNAFSSIYRIGKDYFHDGGADDVELDMDDRFALDGQRLVHESGTYGAAGSIYKTEFFSNSTIRSIGPVGDGSGYFVMETADGKVLEFGNSTNSKVCPGGSNVAIEWRINKISDALGNYMIFEYDKTDIGESYLKSIKYTGNTNANIEPYNEIHFYYQKGNLVTKYIAGQLVQRNLLLRKINVLSSGHLVREYRLGYNSRLISVSEYNGNLEDLNATTFEYEDSPSIYDKVNSNVSFSGGQVYWGDFNGDGFNDYVKLSGSSFSVYANDKSGNFNLLQGPVSLGTVYVFDAYSGDFNGDGISDLAFNTEIDISGCSEDANNYIVKFYSGSTTGLTLKSSYNYNFTCANNKKWNYIGSKAKEKGMSGDIDGDGIDDVVIFGETVGILKGTPGSQAIIPLNFTFPDDNSKFIADVDADSKAEYITFSVTGLMKVYEFTGSALTLSWSYNFGTKRENITWGDFNADGKTDILCIDPQNIWNVLYGTGNGFAVETTSIGMDKDKDGIFIADINGNGKSEIVCVKDYYIDEQNPPPARLYIYCYEKENGSWGSNYVIRDLIVDVNGVGPGYLEDITGDGQADLVFGNPATGSQLYFTFETNIDVRLLTSMMNGTGYRTEIAYGNIAKIRSDGKYNIVSTPAFPQMVLRKGLDVVTGYKTYSSQNNNALVSDIEYIYTNALIHRQGLGYMGFGKIKVINLITKTANETTFDIYGERFVPMVNKQEAFYNNNLNARATFTHGLNIRTTGTGGKIYFAYSPTIVSTDFLKNNTVTKTNVFNNTSWVLESVQESFADGSYSKVEYSNYLNGILPQVIIKKNKSASDPTIFTTEDNISYHASYYYPLNVISNKTLPTQVTTYFQNYDNFGNALSISTTPLNLNTITKTYTYDNTGRFVLTETDALGSISSTYNHLGQVETSTDLYGNITEYSYDSWNRLESVTSPTGVESRSTVDWASEDAPGECLYEKLSQTDNLPYSKAYFDCRGNVLRTETVGFGNIVYNQDNQYNPQNQLTGTSNVFEAGTSGLWNTYTYSTSDGRLTETDAIGGAQQTFEYSGLSVSTTINGNTYTKLYNPAGQLVSSTNPMGSSVNYTYFSHGGVNTVTSPGGTMSYIYEPDGRLKSVTDPLLGTWTYTSNSIGQVDVQTDSRGNRFDTDYDNLNRPVRIKNLDNAEETNIVYVTSGNGKGQVQSITYTDGSLTSSYSFTYDILGRVNTKIQTIGAETITDTYTYNKYNQVVSVTNSIGKTVDYVYNNLGILYQKKYQGNVIWTLQASTLTTTQELLGNGQSLTATRNQYGLLTSIKSGTKFDWAFDFNSTNGNLNSRTQKRYNADGTLNKTLTESFTYDNLDRLLSVNSSGNDVTVAYDNSVKERIASKTDVGLEYQYNTGKPYSLDQVNTPTTQLIQESGDNITYTSFNKVKTITRGVNKLSYSYGPNGERVKAVFEQNNAIVYTKYYFVGYEKMVYANGTITGNFYVGAGSAVMLDKTVNSTSQKYYLLQDYLGSVLTILDNSGNIVEENSFDAWGRRRNPTDWTFNNVPTPQHTTRGYTGHEHITEFGYINMNGRVYDPLLALFLSPDPTTQFPDNPLSYNRYSYVSNNPLKYSDPSGYYRQSIHRDFPRFGAFGGLGGLGTTRTPRDLSYDPSFYHYNYNTGRYENFYGEEISFEQVLSAIDPHIGHNSNGNDINHAVTDEILKSLGWEVVATDNLGNKGVMVTSNGKTTYYAIPFYVFTGSYFNDAYFYGGIAAFGGNPNDPYWMGNSASRQGSDNNIIGGINTLVGAYGTYYGFKGNATHNGMYWRGKNGKFYSTSKLTKPGGYARSYKVVNNSMKTAKGLSNSMAGVSLVITGVDVIYNQEINASDAVNAFMAGISFTGVGSIVAGAYFLTDLGFEVFTGTSLGDRIDNAVGGSLYEW